MTYTINSSIREPRANRRILIVDDHPLVRRGLTVLIESTPDLTICGEAASPDACLAAIDSFRPELVITDLSLGVSDGLAMIKDIRSSHAHLPILILTMHNEPPYAERAFRAGASGYVSKQEMDETLLSAIRCVLDGETFVSPKIQTRLDNG